MREIKFRCFYRGQMYPVLELHGEEGMTVNGLRINFDGLGIRIFHPYQEHVKAVMQFTGLKDKNGVEIYESDIVKAENWNTRVFHTEFILAPVVFSYGQYWLQTPAGFHSLYDTNGEVIGNVHQNPELLNTKP